MSNSNSKGKSNATGAGSALSSKHKASGSVSSFEKENIGDDTFTPWALMA